jgi:hypothetical protein
MYKNTGFNCKKLPIAIKPRVVTVFACTIMDLSIIREHVKVILANSIHQYKIVITLYDAARHIYSY